MTTQSHRKSQLRPIGMLALGAAAGLVLAAFGLLRGSRSAEGLPDGAIARVNAAPLWLADYERLVAGVESDTRSVAAEATRRRVLDRMIDEELLVQRGLELGLASSDRRVRSDLSSAVIRSVVVEAEQQVPSTAELEAFFESEIAFFTRPGRIRVQQIFFRVRSPDEDATAASRAADASARLAAGESFDSVRSAGDPAVSRIPDALLPVTKLRDYIGSAATSAAMKLAVGESSAPLRSDAGYRVLQVVEREEDVVPAFEALEPQIRAEWQRRAGDEALADYLMDLRKRADLVIDDAALGSP